MPLEVRRTANGLQLDLSGEWGMPQFASLESQLETLDVGSARDVRIVTQGLTALNLSGAWALRQFLARAGAAGAAVSFDPAPPDQLRLVDETLKAAEPAAAPAPAAGEQTPSGLLAAIGRWTVDAADDLTGWLAFFGRVTTTFLASLPQPRRLRPISIARHVYDTGITAIPIVALIAFLISVIVAYMSAQQLRGFGADIYVVDLVTIGVLRELGVLLTAIIVAGRSGSAFAAEIGSMQLNEEVDALVATGVDPFEVLVLPRILGLIIALPLLTIIADVVGLTGGALLCRYLLDMPLSQYRATACTRPSRPPPSGSAWSRRRCSRCSSRSPAATAACRCAARRASSAG